MSFLKIEIKCGEKYCKNCSYALPGYKHVYCGLFKDHVSVEEKKGEGEYSKATYYLGLRSEECLDAEDKDECWLQRG